MTYMWASAAATARAVATGEVSAAAVAEAALTAIARHNPALNAFTAVTAERARARAAAAGGGREVGPHLHQAGANHRLG